VKKDYVDNLESKIRQIVPELPKINYSYVREPFWKVLLWHIIPNSILISGGQYNTETNEITIFPNNISATKLRTKTPDNIKLIETIFHEYFHWRRHNIYYRFFLEGEMRGEEKRATNFSGRMLNKFIRRIRNGTIT
jgi:hypothetical protein